MRCQCVGANVSPDARDAVTGDDADQASVAVVSMNAGWLELDLEVTCLEKREWKSKSDREIFRHRVLLRNQKRETVLECISNILSTIPSAKYSCSGSPLMFSNGSTAIDGLSGSGRAAPNFSIGAPCAPAHKA